MRRRALDMRKRSSRLRSRLEEASTPLPSLAPLLRIISSVCNVDRFGDFFSKYGDAQLRGVLTTRQFESMMKALLPLREEDLQTLVSHYSVDELHVNMRELFSDANLLDPNLSSENRMCFNLEDNSSSHPHTLQLARRQVVESLRRMDKGASHLFKFFTLYDRVGAGVCSSVQFARVLQRAAAQLPESLEDNLLELLQSLTGDGMINYVAFVRFCFPEESYSSSEHLRQSGSFDSAVSVARPQSAMSDRRCLPFTGATTTRASLDGKTCGRSSAGAANRVPQRPLTAAARLNSSPSRTIRR